MRGSARLGDRAALGVAALAVGALVVVPLVRLGQVLTEQRGSSLSRVLHGRGLSDAAMHTALLVGTVPILAVTLGSAMALLLRHTDLPLRGVLLELVVLPLVVPQFVLGYSWSQAYGRGGFTDSLLGLHWAGLEGPVGVIVVLVIDTAPLSFLLTTAGLATRAQPELEHAARLSGAGDWTVLRTVSLPLLRPVFAAELALSFVATLESFAVPQVLGTPAGFSTMTTRIYADLALASNPDSFVDAVTLAAALVVVAAVVLVPADLVLAPKLRAARTGGGGVRTAVRGRGRGAAGALAISGYTALAVGLPTVALVAASVTRAVGLPPTPSNWTSANFRTALNAPTIDAIGNSIWLAGCAAFVLTALGALVAALERRRSGRALGTAATLTFAIPGSALAVGLLIAYGRWLGGTLALILVAYLAKFLALAHRAASGAVDRLPDAEWQAARTSGARPAVAATTVWLPALGPALLAGWLLVFLGALHEVTMSSLLYSVDNQTLAVAVLNSQELGEVGATAALSVVLTALMLGAGLPVWLGLRAMSRRRTGRARAQRALPLSTPETAGAR